MSLDETALVPPEATTVTSTAPVPWAGDTAVIDVDENTVKDSAANRANRTAVTTVKFAPVIVTVVPPVVEPLAGVTAVTVGSGGGT